MKRQIRLRQLRNGNYKIEELRRFLFWKFWINYFLFSDGGGIFYSEESAEDTYTDLLQLPTKSIVIKENLVDVQ